MILHILRTALAGGDDLILVQELVGGLLEGLADLELPARILPLSPRYQSSAKSFAMGKAVLLRGDSPVLSGQIG